MAARASIVGACETSVGKVREHNEDSHFIDVGHGIFAVCDGMGGHAAGEVASAIAVDTLRSHWASDEVAKAEQNWLDLGTPEARRQLIQVVQAGVVAAHTAIVTEAERDKTKHGMGTTVVGALMVGGDIVFAHCGDSRAYIVRDAIAMQLTEDHTLLARLLAAGIDVDTSNEGARFKSMLTHALGIGQECKVATFIVPVATDDQFLLCSDGITEYVKEVEIGEVLSSQPSPARAAQRLVELALQRGGADNATALCVKVVAAGETARPAEQLQRDQKIIASCPLWMKCTPQGILRGLRIALPRDWPAGERIPAQTLGDRVAWIIVDGEVELEGGAVATPGAILYPEALVPGRALPDKHGLGVVAKDVRALALRADDFKELCVDDPELGEQLEEALVRILERPRRARAMDDNEEEPTAVHRDPHGATIPPPMGDGAVIGTAPTAQMSIALPAAPAAAATVSATAPTVQQQALVTPPVAPPHAAPHAPAHAPPSLQFEATLAGTPLRKIEAAALETAPTQQLFAPVLPPRRVTPQDLGTAATLPPRKHVAPPPVVAAPVAPKRPRNIEDEPTRPDGPVGTARAEMLGRSPTPPMGIEPRAPAPPKIGATKDAHDAALATAATLPGTTRSPIAPPGSGASATTLTGHAPAPIGPPPLTVDLDIGHGPTLPQISIVKPPPTAAASTPPVSRAEASQEIDRVFLEITAGTARKAAPSGVAVAPAASNTADDPETEITIEAEPPPPAARAQQARGAAPRRVEDDEMEISIERFVELEVDEPMNDGTPGATPATPAAAAAPAPASSPAAEHRASDHRLGSRPVTANDASHVAGSIDTKPD